MIVSINDLIVKMNDCVEKLEFEMSWVEQAGTWKDTVDDFVKMTALLRSVHKVHETWLHSLEAM